MKSTPLPLFLALLFPLLATDPAGAAAPKDGRYKGTMTFLTVVDGTKAEVKKVILVAGILAGGELQMVITEIPEIGSYFTSRTFFAGVADGVVTMRPNNNANPFSLSNVKTSTGAIKGSTDFGLFSTPTGSGSARVLLDLALTRTGS